MPQQLSLPNKYKKPGWIILLISIILGAGFIFWGYEPGWLGAKVLSIFPSDFLGNDRYCSWININLTRTITGSLFIIGALLVGFSKEKQEDEYIAKIRLTSLLWAILVNYILLFTAFIFVYNMAFLQVMIFNMFTVLLIFILRFNYMLTKALKSAIDEK
jgi:hypothetical protein